MSKKHIVGGLAAVGAAAVAGVAAMATVQILKKKQQDLEAPEEAILLDLYGDGEVDVKLEDRDGDVKIDTVTTETAPAQAETPAEPEEPAQKTTEAPEPPVQEEAEPSEAPAE